jgi:hypothetical protein
MLSVTCEGFLAQLVDDASYALENHDWTLEEKAALSSGDAWVEDDVEMLDKRLNALG